jgi:hypothetical protein
MRRLVIVLALAGCGSAPLPPAAGPGGEAQIAPGVRAVVDPVARRLIVGAESAPAGVGPTAVECVSRWCYVLDTQGHGLLLFRVRPLELLRRQYIAGRPVRMRRVGDLLAITLAHGEVVWFSTGALPHRVPAPTRPAAPA